MTNEEMSRAIRVLQDRVDALERQLRQMREEAEQREREWLREEIEKHKVNVSAYNAYLFMVDEDIKDISASDHFCANCWRSDEYLQRIDDIAISETGEKVTPCPRCGK